MEHFTPWASLFGGMLIGLAATLLLLMTGRVAGISGIFGAFLMPQRGNWRWTLMFVLGLVAGGLAFRFAVPDAPPLRIAGDIPLMVGAGLLVGFGTRLGSGCTSGHGICGIANLSARSLAATVIFLGVAIATVFVTRHVLG